MNSDYYTLKGITPVKCDLIEYNRILASDERMVAVSYTGDYKISTVFLPINHEYRSGYPPLLFETAIFKDRELTEIYNRYSTWEEAEAGHKKAVEYVGSELVPF